jgi:hypothetical protein
MSIEGYRMEDKEVTRRGAKIKEDIRKKSPELVTEKINIIQEESVRKRANILIQEAKRKMTGRGREIGVKVIGNNSEKKGQ